MVYMVYIYIWYIGYIEYIGYIAPQPLPWLCEESTLFFQRRSTGPSTLSLRHINSYRLDIPFSLYLRQHCILVHTITLPYLRVTYDLPQLRLTHEPCSQVSRRAHDGVLVSIGRPHEPAIRLSQGYTYDIVYIVCIGERIYTGYIGYVTISTSSSI